MSDFRRTGLFTSPRGVIATLGAISLSALAVFTFSSAPADAGDRDASTLQSEINQAFSVSKSQVARLNLPEHVGMGMDIQVPINGEMMTLNLTPHSSRSAEHYRVRLQIEDGSLVDVEPGDLRTMRGSIVELPGSRVAASLLDDGLHAAIVMPDHSIHWVQPIASLVPGAAFDEHIVYAGADSLCEGVCGVDGAMLRNQVQMHVDQMGLVDQGPQPIGTVCKVAEIAIDADVQYFNIYGSNTENRINQIIDTVNALYESSVGIRHEITEIIIRTSSASNPYTTNNASTLLGQFRNVWRTQPELSIPRDVAHLFTGRNLGSTLGIAWLGVICDSPQFGNGYGLSSNIGNFGCATDLTAHELGHNWNAPHCSCPSFTMNPSITCANNFTNGTINTIINHRNSRTCLSDCPPPGPSNSVCSQTVVLSEGQHTFTNIGAETTGPAEPNHCNAFGDNNIQSDVYFGHIASCTGELTISLCGSSFSTKVAVYNFPCPTSPGEVIACDVTSCPTSTRSQVTLPVTQGQAIRIRVGGLNGAQGNGVITLSCEASEPLCPADLNGDGVVNVSDLLILLGEWGDCAGCDSDLNNDGVVNVSDLLVLLGAWGQCE